MKRCDLCGKREPAMTVRQVTKDGRTTEIAICAECAKLRGFTTVEKLKKESEMVLAELKARVDEQDKKITCKRCQMSFAEFKRRGKLGCAECYQTFAEQLKPLIRRLHSAVQHIGKTPHQGRKRAQERLQIQRLRAELERAIKEENYERAAALRDQLKKAGEKE